MEEKIIQLSNIQAIAKSSLFVFGTLTLWLVYKMIGAFILNYSLDSNGLREEGDLFMPIVAGFTIAACFASLATIGSYGLLRLKKWGLILYHAITIVFALALLAFLIYKISGGRNDSYSSIAAQFDGESSKRFRMYQYFSTIGIGMFVMLFSWILARVNLFLGNPVNRCEFK